MLRAGGDRNFISLVKKAEQQGDREVGRGETGTVEMGGERQKNADGRHRRLREKKRDRRQKAT